MNKYIPAEKLIAEIDRRIKHQQTCIENKYRLLGKAEEEIIFEYKSLSSFITSLQQEQPEVDLEEYIENEIKHYGLSLYEPSYGTFSAGEIERIMRKFYELGLNARMEE